MTARTRTSRPGKGGPIISTSNVATKNTAHVPSVCVMACSATCPWRCPEVAS
jgi:hypothetical protein